MVVAFSLLKLKYRAVLSNTMGLPKKKEATNQHNGMPYSSSPIYLPVLLPTSDHTLDFLLRIFDPDACWTL